MDKLRRIMYNQVQILKMGEFGVPFSYSSVLVFFHHHSTEKRFVFMDWSTAWAVVITGMVVVFVALIVLVAVVSLFGAITSRLTGKKPPKEEKKAAPAAPKAAPAAKSNVVNASTDDEDVAAIMGAISLIFAEEGNQNGFTLKSVSLKRNRRRLPLPVWAASGVRENVTAGLF